METSIEDEHEPRTLHLHHIKHARDAALYVLNTRSMQEAFAIFTEGLEPVVRCAKGGRFTSIVHYANDKEDKQCPKDSNQRVQEPRRLRDIVSAPF